MQLDDDRGNIWNSLRICIAEGLKQTNREEVDSLQLQTSLDMFMNMKIREGQEDEAYFFNAENLHEIYDLYFLIHEQGVVAAAKFLRETLIPAKNEMIERQELELHSIMIFESPILAKEREHEEIAIALQDDRGILSETSACGRCSSTQNHMKIKQTRSVDEGPTTIITCSRCKNCWSEG
jgi:DNA-directed RNA polymerase subunit M/transcription elongation factor TFIIS